MSDQTDETDVETRLSEFSADAFSNDKLTVSGTPGFGERVEIEYNSNAGGSYNAPDGSTIAGELIHVGVGFRRRGDTRKWNGRLTFIVHDPDGDRAVKFRLDAEGTGTVTISSLKARNTKRGRRIGRVSAITFTGEDAATTITPTARALRAVNPGDVVSLNGSEYGVVELTEYGPTKVPQDIAAVLTRPDGDEYTLKTSMYSGSISLTERFERDSELDVDPESVHISRFRARYYDSDNERLPEEPEDTRDVFPAPHGARDGERLTFALTREDGEDEQVSGEVVGVRYFKQQDRTSILSDVEVQDPETTVELDDGREVRLRNCSKGNRVVTPNRWNHLGEDYRKVTAFVITHTGEDSENEYEHIHATDVEPEPEVRTDGGEDIANPPVVVPGEDSDAECYHKVTSPCRFQVSGAREMKVSAAQRRGYGACSSCDPPTFNGKPEAEDAEGEPEVRADGGEDPEELSEAVSVTLADSADISLNSVSVHVDERDGAVAIRGNGPMSRDTWTNLRDTLTTVLDREGYQYEAKDAWAFVQVTGRGDARPDGGQVQRAPDGGSVDPHAKVKRKVINADAVLMVKSAGVPEGCVAVHRERDADDDLMEQYRMVMEICGYTELDASKVEFQRGVSGGDVTVDVWKQKEAMTDGGVDAAGSESGGGDTPHHTESGEISGLYRRVERALRSRGLHDKVAIRPDRKGVTIQFSELGEDTVRGALTGSGVTPTDYSTESRYGPGPGECVTKVRVLPEDNRGGRDD